VFFESGIRSDKCLLGLEHFLFLVLFFFISSSLELAKLAWISMMMMMMMGIEI